MDDDLEYLHPVLNSPSQQYGNVPTIWATVSYIIVTVVLEITAVTVYVNWPSNAIQCEPLFLFLYGHAVLWVVTLIFDHYLKWRHHNLYLHGYFNFSEHLRKISSLPLHIVSLWNAVSLAVIAWYHQSNGELENACRQTDIKSPVVGVLLLTSIEVVLLVMVLVNYSLKVYKFNADKMLPDVEIASDWAPLHSFVSDELGFTDWSYINGVEELLRKQADRIRFYENESEALKRKILALNNFRIGESIN